MFSDFGGFPPGRARRVIAVTTLDDLATVITTCFSQRMPMRVRCFAHSMNGMSVPRSDEALLDMSDVRHLAWNGGSSITAGAGLSVVEVDRYVQQFGWALPLTNDGGAEAPSVGGFIAAGGIGEGTIFNGGFWETVNEIVLVLGDGSVARIARDAPLFRWLFGSMGTLGVVYEANLDLVPVRGSAGLPIADVLSLPRGSPAPWPKHLWLTLFMETTQHEAAVDQLGALVTSHPAAWIPRKAYEYYLPCKRANPPLLFDGDTDFMAIGTWGDRIDEASGLDAYFKLEADFQRLVEQSGFRRYFQSELIWETRPLECYIGRACAAEYFKIKNACDPAALLNGRFFVAETQDTVPLEP